LTLAVGDRNHRHARSVIMAFQDIHMPKKAARAAVFGVL